MVYGNCEEVWYGGKDSSLPWVNNRVFGSYSFWRSFNQLTMIELFNVNFFFSWEIFIMRFFPLLSKTMMFQTAVVFSIINSSLSCSRVSLASLPFVSSKANLANEPRVHLQSFSNPGWRCWSNVAGHKTQAHTFWPDVGWQDFKRLDDKTVLKLSVPNNLPRTPKATHLIFSRRP